ncbi:MAG: DMT family transporter [Brevirhabdus sp.]
MTVEMVAARREALRGHFAMLLFSALVAGSFSLGGLAANLMAPEALNAVRFLIAGVIIGVAALATTGIPRRALAAPWRYAILGGLFAVYFATMFEGLKTAPPVSTAAVFTLTPALAAVFGWLLLRQITTPRIALALAIGGGGALWVIFRADLDALLAFRIGTGESIYFIGVVAHAIYTPMVRRLNRGEAPVVFSFFTLLAGLVVLTFWGWDELFAIDWAGLPRIVWITILYTAVFASAATFVLLQYATLRLPSSKVMAYTYLTPSWVILWEIALGHGAPPALIMVGIGLTMVALWMLLGGDG